MHKKFLYIQIHYTKLWLRLKGIITVITSYDKIVGYETFVVLSTIFFWEMPLFMKYSRLNYYWEDKGLIVLFIFIGVEFVYKIKAKNQQQCLDNENHVENKAKI